MADRVLFITWERPARGLEERALESFNEALGIAGRRQQDGRIEGFDVVLFEPNGELGGYIAIRGSAEQIAALREDDEFRHSTANAMMCVDGMRHLEGRTDEAVAGEIEMFEEAIATVPQRT